MLNSGLLRDFAKYAPGYRAGLRANPSRTAMDHGSQLMRAYDANSMFNNGGVAMDAAIAGGMAFLEGELEKRDTKVREPLTSITYPRDIDIKTGGGWVDKTSTFAVTYATTGPNQLGFIGGQSTQIPIIQADVVKDLYDVTNWGHVMKVTFIDLQKAANTGRSLDDMYDKGIRLNWNKSLDLTTYLGWGQNAGLFNNANITQTTVPAGVSGFTQWIHKTPGEILFDINTALVSTYAASNFDVTGMADTLLIPPTQFGYISTQPITAAGNESILEWALKKNIAQTHGRTVKIFDSRWASGAGVGGTDRMLAYVRDEDRVYLDVTVPMQRVMTQPTVQEGGSYLTLYLGQIGVVKYLYYFPVLYSDGI